MPFLPPNQQRQSTEVLETMTDIKFHDRQPKIVQHCWQNRMHFSSWSLFLVDIIFQEVVLCRRHVHIHLIMIAITFLPTTQSHHLHTMLHENGSNKLQLRHQRAWTKAHQNASGDEERKRPGQRLRLGLCYHQCSNAVGSVTKTNIAYKNNLCHLTQKVFFQNNGKLVNPNSSGNGCYNGGG